MILQKTIPDLINIIQQYVEFESEDNRGSIRLDRREDNLHVIKFYVVGDKETAYLQFLLEPILFSTRITVLPYGTKRVDNALKTRTEHFLNVLKEEFNNG